MSPHTVLRAIGPEPWAVAYPEPCRRPTDGRYGDNPNRAQHYFQYQVLIKPSPDGIESIDGLVFGTYIHGLFHNTAIRQSIVKFISESKGIMVANNDYEYSMDNEYNKLADWVRNSLDMDLLYRITGLETQINFRD